MPRVTRCRSTSARSGLDLPIVASGDSGVVAVLALIQSVDPALFQSITGARGFARGGVLLESGLAACWSDATPGRRSYGPWCW